MIFAAIALFAVPVLQCEVRSGEGLNLSVDGVPLVRGSGFQYYEPGWTKGYYSSNWGAQVVERTSEGRRLTFRSDDGRAYGSQTFVVSEDRVTVRSEFHWDGEGTVLVELTGGLVWAPAVQEGSLTIDGRPTRSLAFTGYRSSAMGPERTYGQGREYAFDAPLGRLSVATEGGDWTIFDGRGYDQDWASGRELLWLGSPGLPVSKGSPAVATIEWRFGAASVSPVAPVEVAVKPTRISSARFASEPLPILPKPKETRLSGGVSRALGTVRWIGSEGVGEELARTLGEDFETLVATRWSGSRTGRSLSVKARLADLKMPPEGYSIAITTTGAEIVGQDRQGLRHAARTLAKLVRPWKGGLALPVGIVRDWPSVGWRGVHLFVGPKALELHRRLFDRALLPLGFNHAVLQCERTDWRATPGIATAITMSRDDLAAEFAWLRRKGVEPIPLIQSFGHMEWLFANGKNLDLAQNPSVPYAVDVTNPGSRALLEAIWREAVALLRPRTIHFGLDEVDMRGYPDDPELVTQHWERHLPWLGQLAKTLEVRPMLWGDKALAPGEAIDAAHGHSREHASRRRAAIPSDAIIADWHYRAEESPEPFRGSLRLWMDTGRLPVASAWYRPENVRGFALAAKAEGAGFLQTTWAGYESNEDNVLREFGQFAAMVIAADYAWSGRDERVGQLPYDATTFLGKSVFGSPGVSAAVPGTSLLPGEVRRVGEYGFTRGTPIRLVNRLTLSGVRRPTEATITLDKPEAGGFLALACRTETILAEGEVVGRVEVGYGSGAPLITELRYGRHVRSAQDPRGLVLGDRADGDSVLVLKLDARRTVKQVRFVASAPHAGLTVDGATLVQAR